MTAALFIVLMAAILNQARELDMLHDAKRRELASGKK